MAAGYFQQIKTGIAKLDGVLSGASWDTTDLTYSFPDGSGDYENDYFDNAAKNNAKPLNADQRDAVESVLAQLESFTLLTLPMSPPPRVSTPRVRTIRTYGLQFPRS